jgi:hypothetical protein
MVSIAPDDIAPVRVPVAAPAFGCPECVVDVLLPLGELLPLLPHAAISSGTAAVSAAPALAQWRRAVCAVMSISDFSRLRVVFCLRADGVFIDR